MEVIWNPGDSNMIILRVRRRSTSRREEGESLYETDSEEQHLVPSQSLPHAPPLSHSEGNEAVVFLVSISWKLQRRIRMYNGCTFHPLR